MKNSLTKLALISAIQPIIDLGDEDIGNADTQTANPLGLSQKRAVDENPDEQSAHQTAGGKTSTLQFYIIFLNLAVSDLIRYSRRKPWVIRIS